jgi:regulator of protease activity HflC (stomatin/prohibitin superfamily)
MEEKTLVTEEKLPRPISGMAMLILGILLLAGSIVLFVLGVIGLSRAEALGIPASDGYVVMMVIGAVYWIFAWVPFAGLKIIKPNEALVLTLFGKYYGSLKDPGFFYVNPFCVGVNPAVREPGADQAATVAAAAVGATSASALDAIRKKDSASGKKISLKAITHNNGKQKINDLLGNPIDVGIVVIWRVVNTAKAVFNVDDYREYLSIQTDAALRNTVRLYPYDVADGGDDNDGQTSLRGSSQAVADKIKDELQRKVEMAGLEILETRITYLAYSPEIAAAMLQRQQASAIIDARKMIVDGAVGMVEMALEKLKDGGVVELDEERKAAMVSNLLVVLCGNRDAQPVVNSGSLY